MRGAPILRSAHGARGTMLERPRLTIGPWQPEPAAGGTAGVRLIRDAAAGEQLGVVVRSSAMSETRWRFWSNRPALEVCETDDRATIMSIRPSRLTKGMWSLRDCDGNNVGRLQEGEILDPWGHPFARRELDATGAWILREIDGRVYASCATKGDADLVSFLDSAPTNPYLRMLILGSFLLLRR